MENLNKPFINLQMFNEGTVTTGATQTPENVTAAPATQQTQTQQTQGTVGQTTTAQPEIPEHRIKSALASAEQQWLAKNKHKLELAEELERDGLTAEQALQRVRETRQQRQIQQQQQQAQQMGVHPQVLQQMQAMQGQIEQFTRAEGERALAAAETQLTEYAKGFGVDYKDTKIRDEVREFALANNVNLDVAFRNLYFERITTVTAQKAQGDVLATLQGRGAQPLSTASTGSANQGPVDWTKASAADFQAEKARRRGEHFG